MTSVEQCDFPRAEKSTTQLKSSILFIEYSPLAFTSTVSPNSITRGTPHGKAATLCEACLSPNHQLSLAPQILSCRNIQVTGPLETQIQISSTAWLQNGLRVFQVLKWLAMTGLEPAQYATGLEPAMFRSEV